MRKFECGMKDQWILLQPNSLYLAIFGSNATYQLSFVVLQSFDFEFELVRGPRFARLI